MTRWMAAVGWGLGLVAVGPLAWAGGSGGSGGPLGTRQDWPCPGCFTHVPATYDGTPTPLLVALHGDEGIADYAYQIWYPYTEAHGYILLAPKCPSAEGCAGSWWQWGGDPAWLVEQIQAVEGDYDVELEREYGSAWSGGATYLGATLPSFVPRFAALNFNGGGVPPQPPTCPSCRAPAYFMIGDQDFLYDYAVATHSYLQGCGHETVWDELPGLDHQAGIGALSSQDKADTILDWLSARPNSCPTDPGTGGAGGAAGTGGQGASGATGAEGGAAAAGGGPGGSAGSAGAPVGAEDGADEEGCGCRLVGARPGLGRGSALALLGLGAIGARRRARLATRPSVRRRARVGS